MTLEDKDRYIENDLMKLEPDTLRYMVADLTAALEDHETLRDKFAIAAMTGFNKGMVDYGWSEDVLIGHAKQAYAVADAMLIARQPAE